MNLEYMICPLRNILTNLLVDYLKKLDDHDLIKYRFADIVNPGVKEVYDSFDLKPNNTYFVIGTSPFMIRAEFTISDHFGRVGLMHFSMAPENTFKESLFLARDVIGKIFREWKSADKPDEPYVTSLVGLTPVPNRRACLFITKVGFKRITVLPDAAHYNGVICDALLTIKTREDK